MEKIIHWLLDHRKALFVFLLVATIVAFIISFLSNNAFIYLEVAAINKNSETVTYGSSDSGNNKIGNSGLMIVSRSVKSLLVTNGKYIKTQTQLDIPWFGFLHKNIQLTQDNNAQKVAYKSTSGTTCSSYNKSNDVLFYFACRNPRSIMYYDTPKDKGWTTKKIADIYYSGNEAKPYMGGVIGVAHIEATDTVAHGDIVHTTEKGKPVAYKAPENIDESTIRNMKLFTDTIDTTNNKFVLVSQSGDIYLASPQSRGGISYREIPAPEKYNDSFNETYCSLKGELVYCYRGKSSIGDAPTADTLTNIADYEIIKASFTDNNVSNKKITNAEGVLNINDIFVVDDDIFIQIYKKLYRIESRSDNYEISELLQNVDSTTASTNLYVLQSGGVYMKDKNSSDFHQIFYSDNIIPKKIYTTEDKVFIIGNIKGNNKVTYAYSLNDEPNLTPGKRLIDILPTTSGALTGSTANDLVGNRLLITLPVITTKATRGQSGINTGEMAARKAETLQALGALTDAIDENNVQFTY